MLGERIERNLLRVAHAAARGKCLTPGRQISPRILDPQPQQQMGAQRCGTLTHALPDRLLVPNGRFREHVPNPRLRGEQNAFQDFLDHRSKPPGTVARSKAVLAISLIAATVNIKSGPWNRTSLRYWAIKLPLHSVAISPYFFLFLSMRR